MYAEKAYDAEELNGHTASQFATSSHTHPEYAEVSHVHSEYALKTHTHESESLLPVAQGYFRKDASYCWGCNNVESCVWNSTYNRYEITITDVYFSNDDRAFISIHGGSSICPAGATGRVDSVSGKLLVYIVAADGSNIQCLFSFIAFQGQ